MSESKPLTQEWRDDYPLSGDMDHSYAIDANAHHDCANDVDEWAREHLSEQAEPSDEDLKIVQWWNHPGEGICHMKWCSRCEHDAMERVKVRNATLRKIRESLVGKPPAGSMAQYFQDKYRVEG